MAVEISARISAKRLENHTPSICQIKGRVSISEIWKTTVLRNARIALVAPSLSAVKKEEPYIAKPEQMKVNENI